MCTVGLTQLGQLSFNGRRCYASSALLTVNRLEIDVCLRRIGDYRPLFSPDIDVVDHKRVAQRDAQILGLGLARGRNQSREFSPLCLAASL